jgi:hypothetical protein
MCHLKTEDMKHTQGKTRGKERKHREEGEKKGNNNTHLC